MYENVLGQKPFIFLFITNNLDVMDLYVECNILSYRYYVQLRTDKSPMFAPLIVCFSIFSNSDHEACVLCTQDCHEYHCNHMYQVFLRLDNLQRN